MLSKSAILKKSPLFYGVFVGMLSGAQKPVFQKKFFFEKKGSFFEKKVKKVKK